MATLSYDISVLGLRSVDAAFAHIERRAKVHNQTVAGGVAGRRGPYRTPSGGRTGTANETWLERERHASKMRDQRREHQEAQRQINREHKQRLNAIRQELAARRKANQAAAAQARRNAVGTAGAIGRGAVGSVAAIGRGVTSVAAIGGTALVASSLAKEASIEKQAAALANKAYRTPGETRSREEIRASVMAQASQVGRVTGDRAGAIESLNKVVGISGSLKAGQQMMPFMSDLSDATGAAIADIGSTTGIILQNLAATRGYDLGKQEDLDKAVDATQRIMGRMAGQAKIGSIEFEQLATNMASVMSATGRFEGDIEDLAAQMGAIGQLAIAGGASSPEEAMTALKRFSDDIIKNAGRFEKMATAAGIDTGGVFVKNEAGKRVALQDPTKLIMDMMRVTGGDLPSIQKVFNVRSLKAFEPFSKAFVSAKAKGATDEQAFAAIQEQMDRFRQANVGRGEMRQSAAFARAQTGRELQVVWEDLQAEIGSQLLPTLKELGPDFVELAKSVKGIVPYVKEFMKQLADNPMGMILKLMAARIAFDVASAGIGNAIRTALMQQMMASSAGAGIAGAGGAGGVLGRFAGGGVTPVTVMNAAAIGAALGTIVYAAIDTWGKAQVNKAEANTSRIMKQAATGDEKQTRQAKKEAEAGLASIQEDEETRSLVQQRLNSPAAAFGIPGLGGAAAELDIMKDQRGFDKRNLETAQKTAEHRVNMAEFNQFIEQSKAGVTALDGFYKKLNELNVSSVPRGDQPAPPKPPVK